MADVVVVIEDLIFSTKIQGTARALGLDAQVVRTGEALQEALDQGEVRLVVVDMGLGNDTATTALRGAASHELKPTTLAFYSHVQQELRRAAEEAGAHVVMVRSQFSEELPQLLKQYCSSAG